MKLKQRRNSLEGRFPLCLALLLLGTLFSRVDAIDQETASWNPREFVLRRARGPEEVHFVDDSQSANKVLITLTDGRLIALDAETGHQEWLISTGPALLSSSVTFTGNKVRPGSEEALLPGLDGSLVWLRGKGERGEAILERLGVSIPALVESLPSVANDGSVLLGSKTSTIAAVDPVTGTTVRTLHLGSGPWAARGEDMLAALDPLEYDPEPEPEALGHRIPLIYFGRSYFEVRAVDVHTGAERWNVTFGEVRGLGVAASDGSTRPLHRRGGRAAGILTVSSGNVVRWRPEGQREARWAVQLPAHPMHAYLSGSGGAEERRHLEDLPDEEPGSEGPHLSPIELVFLREPIALGGEGDVTSDVLVLPSMLPSDFTLQLSYAYPSSGHSPMSDLSCPLLPPLVPRPQRPKSQLPDPLALPAPEPTPPTEPVSTVRIAAWVVTASFTTSILGAGLILFYVGPKLYPPRMRRSKRLVSRTAGASTPEKESGARELGGGRVGIGQLVVGPGVLGYGSGGTVVYEGSCNGRQVAIKRVLRTYVDLAHRELGSLVKSDDHPNIVRCFALEEDREFLYLALERCKESLADFLERTEGCTSCGPSALSLGSTRQLCEDMAKGLSALHDRGIVHFDLKPYNVLLTDQQRAKLSDLGLAKQVRLGQLSFETENLHQGSSGWQAPEVLNHRIGPATSTASLHPEGSEGLAERLQSGGAASSSGGVPQLNSGAAAPTKVRLTRSVDVFALGCLMHHVITGGGHPFGAPVERDANILKSECDLSALSFWPEAEHLVHACLNADPAKRPSAAAVLAHPFFWDDQRRLSFLVDLSNRMELEDRAADDSLLQEFERLSPHVTGSRGWLRALSPGLVDNLHRYRRYDSYSLRDLLRVIRNKVQHFRELPLALREEMGPLPGGFNAYFASRFPALILVCYRFVVEHLARRHDSPDETVLGYLGPGADEWVDLDPNAEDLCSLACLWSSGAGPPNGAGRGKEASAHSVPPPAARGASPAPRTDAPLSEVPAEASKDADSPSTVTKDPSIRELNINAGVFVPSPPFPPEVKVPATPAVVLPPALQSPSCAPTVAPAPSVPTTAGGPLPKRPGRDVCPFFSKTGYCKFGPGCRYDHPDHLAVPTNSSGYPMRPGMDPCSFFIKTGECKFGLMCKFHHPELAKGPIKP